MEEDGDEVPVLTEEQRIAMEAQFEKTLEEYGDEDMGDLGDEVRTAAMTLHCLRLMSLVGSGRRRGINGFGWQ